MGGERVGAGAAGGLRIGDADRDQISAVLERHAVEGRLTMEELDRRVGVLYAAETRAQAAALLADLPPLTPAGTTEPFHLGHDHRRDMPLLPEWLTDAGPPAPGAPAQPAAPETTRSTADEDRGAARKRAKLRQDENAIGHTFQATRRAINAKLATAAAAGNSGDVTELNERLRDAHELAAAARQAVSAGDRAEVQHLLARLRSLA